MPTSGEGAHGAPPRYLLLPSMPSSTSYNMHPSRGLRGGTEGLHICISRKQLSRLHASVKRRRPPAGPHASSGPVGFATRSIDSGAMDRKRKKKKQKDTKPSLGPRSLKLEGASRHSCHAFDRFYVCAVEYKHASARPPSTMAMYAQSPCNHWPGHTVTVDDPPTFLALRGRMKSTVAGRLGTQKPKSVQVQVDRADNCLMGQYWGTCLPVCM